MRNEFLNRFNAEYSERIAELKERREDVRCADNTLVQTTHQQLY